METDTESTGTASGAVRWARAAIGVLVVGGLAALVGSGALRIDLDTLREAVRTAGPLGVLVFIAAYSLFQPMFVPTQVFILAAPILWPTPLALALSWVGALSASVTAFGTARWLGRDVIQPRLPERIRRLDHALSEGGLRAVIVAKVFLFTSPPLQWVCGLSRLPLRTFVLGTAIGNTPQVVLWTAVGTGLDTWLLS
jgi:uncharacterized membrane protein YdjX (TVP38/TMEM64 family)